MLKHAFALSLAFAVAAPAFAGSADEKPYKDGPVVSVAYIHVKDGKMFDYVEWLNGPWKKEQEAYKKAGLITDYHVYSASPRSPAEPNLILTVTYPNYAALDRTAEFDAVDTQVEGSLKASNKGFAERGSIRDVLGGELIQEMILK